MDLHKLRIFVAVINRAFRGRGALSHESSQASLSSPRPALEAAVAQS